MPNITGTVNGGQLMRTDQNANASGAFSLITGSGQTRPTGEFSASYGVSLDASKASTTYGSSTTVTPLSLSTKFFIKY